MSAEGTESIAGTTIAYTAGLEEFATYVDTSIVALETLIDGVTDLSLDTVVEIATAISNLKALIGDTDGALGTGETALVSRLATLETTVNTTLENRVDALELLTANMTDTDLDTVVEIATAITTIQGLVGTDTSASDYSTSLAARLTTLETTVTTAIQEAIKAVSLVPTLSVVGSDLNDSVLDTAEGDLVVRVGLSDGTLTTDTVELYLNGAPFSTPKTATMVSAGTSGYVQFNVTQIELGGVGAKQLSAVVSQGTVTSNESVGLFFDVTTTDETAPSAATSFPLVVDNTDNDAALEVGETITITFSEAVDVDTLVLGTQFAPTVLNRGDEARLGTGYSVAAVDSGSTSTAFIITLGTAPTINTGGGETEAERTLTFSKTSVVDAAGNPASSHIALVAPSDIKKLFRAAARLCAVVTACVILHPKGSCRSLIGGSDPVKKRGTWVDAHLRVVTPSLR